MIRLILIIEIILAVIALAIWTLLAVLFLMAGGFGSPMHVAFFVMGLMTALVGIYLMIGWVTDMARDWRYL